MIYSTKPSGFTLVEVTVTAGILIVLATLVFLQIRSLSPEQSLDSAQATTRSAYVLARNYSMNGRTCCNDQLPHGYGILTILDGHPDNTLYLYADLDGDHQYSTSDELMTTIIISSDVDITSCQDNSTLVTSSDCDIAFTTNPSQQTYMNGVPSDGITEIQLTYYSTGEARILSIYGFGIIE